MFATLQGEKVVFNKRSIPCEGLLILYRHQGKEKKSTEAKKIQ